MGSSKKKAPRMQASDPSRIETTRDDSVPLLPIPDFEPDELTKVCAGVQESAKDLTKRLATLQRACEEIGNRGALEALARGERTGPLIQTIGTLTAALPGFLTELSQVQTLVEVWQAGERRSRRSRFEQTARVLNWKIIGSWPEPVVNGMVYISLDEPKDRVTINSRPLTGELTAERISIAVEAELATLQRDLTEPAEFIMQVWKAHSARTTGPTVGVFVHDLLAELTWQRQSKRFQRDPRLDLFRGYPLAQFRADLTNYLAAGAPPATVAGKSYELQIVGGSFAQEGIFMYFPQADRLSTCGRLSFQSLDRDEGK